MSVTLKEIAEALTDAGYHAMAKSVNDRDITLPFRDDDTDESVEWPIGDLVESGTPSTENGDMVLDYP